MAPPRPRWEAGPKKAPHPKPRKEKPQLPKQPHTSPLPLDLQQLLLNIFKHAFQHRLDSDIQPLLQEVKGHLYNRDFLTAFGREDYLEAYAARWSPSRALGYLDILHSLQEELQPYPSLETAEEPDHAAAWNVVCLGGGAGAEIIALAGFTKLLVHSDKKPPTHHHPCTHITAIDIANWAPIISTLTTGLTTPPPLSKYASPTAQAANAPLLPSPSPTSSIHFTTSFHQLDILTTPAATLTPHLHPAHLLTLFFTLNELYTASLSRAQNFLLSLSSICQPGALLLVVDSPGSYSTVRLNGAEKKYPMQWLLDHTLLGGAGQGEEQCKWVKVREEESRWFRLGVGVEYPIGLEDMRFQLHLYRRVGG